MRPHIICHMASSIDGKIDGAALRPVMRAGEYEELHKQLNGDAWICGRTTMEEGFAEDESGEHPLEHASLDRSSAPERHAIRRGRRNLIQRGERLSKEGSERSD